MPHFDTVIIGGGIAGLCAAHTLSERGVPTVLLERNGFSLGGRVASYPPTSFEYRGKSHRFSMEHGIHGWWRQYRNFLSLIERLQRTDQLIDAYDQTVIYADATDVYRTNVGRETQLTPVPEPVHHVQLLFKKNIRRLTKLKDFPRILNMAVKVLESIAFDPHQDADKQRYDRLAVADFTRGMPLFFQAFLRSLSRSGFFSDPQHVSLWAFFLALQLYVFLRREDQRFAFPRAGVMESLLTPLVEKCEQRGAVFAKGITVVAVSRRTSKAWTVQWQADDPHAPRPAGFTAASGQIEASNLVLAVDVASAKKLLKTSPDLAPALGDLSAFEGRRATTIRMWWNRPPTDEWGESGVFAGRATADAYFWLNRFQREFERWQKDTGGAVSECHIYAPQSLHQLADEVLIDRVQKDMERAFPELQGGCIHHAIIRNRATHINFPVGCARSFPTVATPYADLVLCGDWIDGGVPVLYMERACQTALAAANLLLERRDLPLVDILQPRAAPLHMQAIQGLLRLVAKGFPGIWLTTAGGEKIAR